jgi:hypothetical protein
MGGLLGGRERGWTLPQDADLARVGPGGRLDQDRHDERERACHCDLCGSRSVCHCRFLAGWFCRMRAGSRTFSALLMPRPRQATHRRKHLSTPSVLRQAPHAGAVGPRERAWTATTTWCRNATVAHADRAARAMDRRWSAMAALNGLPTTAGAVADEHPGRTRLRGTGRDRGQQECDGDECRQQMAMPISSRRVRVVTMRGSHASIFQAEPLGGMSCAPSLAESADVPIATCRRRTSWRAGQQTFWRVSMTLRVPSPGQTRTRL